MSENVNFPVDPTIKVIDGITVYRTPKWWCAITLQINRGRPEVCYYLWLNRINKDTKQSEWVRKQKASFKAENWDAAKTAVDGFMTRIKSGEFGKVKSQEDSDET